MRAITKANDFEFKPGLKYVVNKKTFLAFKTQAVRQYLIMKKWIKNMYRTSENQLTKCENHGIQIVYNPEEQCHEILDHMEIVLGKSKI